MRLATLAKQAGVERFVYMSSCSVYGVADGVVDESSPIDPQTVYAKCKAMVERDVLAMADDGFSPTFLRNATAFGASPRMRFDLVLNNLSGLAWTTKQIAMTSDGTPWRPLVHALDIAKAIRMTLAAPRDAVHGQIFNVGSDEQNYQVREIAGIIGDALPDADVSFGASGGDNRSYKVQLRQDPRGAARLRVRMERPEGRGPAARHLRLDRARRGDVPRSRLHAAEAAGIPDSHRPGRRGAVLEGAVMIFHPTPIAGVAHHRPRAHAETNADSSRGRSDREEFAAAGLDPHLEQANISFNHKAGTLRGMHFQVSPHPETKLVRCIARGDRRHDRRHALGARRRDSSTSRSSSPPTTGGRCSFPPTSRTAIRPSSTTRR